MLDLKQLQAKYPQGSKGGQCVKFCREILKDLPYGLFSIDDKRRILMASGQTMNKGSKHKIGDMIVTSEGEYGHVAIINELNGKYKVGVSESNYKLDEKISHTRWVDLRTTSLQYFWRSNLTLNFLDPIVIQAIEALKIVAKNLYDVSGWKNDQAALELGKHTSNHCDVLLD